VGVAANENVVLQHAPPNEVLLKGWVGVAANENVVLQHAPPNEVLLKDANVPLPNVNPKENQNEDVSLNAGLHLL